MADVWYPDAIRVQGALNENYANGRNRMEVVKRHYTVGFNSWGAGFRGFFQWLVNRDASIYQFAPVDAVCFDSSEWNDAGPGIEVEFYPGVHEVMFTPEMRASTGRLVRWLNTEHGFPLVEKTMDSGRIGEFAGFRGFIDHGALIQTDQHSDYWASDDWAAMTAPPVAEEDYAEMHVYQTESGRLRLFTGARIYDISGEFRDSLVGQGIKNLLGFTDAVVDADEAALAGRVASGSPSEGTITGKVTFGG